MSTSESLIVLLLIVIAWFLYQIAKQLSYLTGKRIRFAPFNKQLQGMRFKSKLKAKTKENEVPLEKLTN